LVQFHPEFESDDRILAEVRKRLLDRWGANISRILLYGSRGRGDADPASDFDLLVVFRGPLSRREARHRFRMALGDLRPWVDLRVVTEDQFQAGRDVVGCLVEAAAKGGKVVYAS
jgi:predicted nucleotidyltransferase